MNFGFYPISDMAKLSAGIIILSAINIAYLLEELLYENDPKCVKTA